MTARPFVSNIVCIQVNGINTANMSYVTFAVWQFYFLKVSYQDKLFSTTRSPSCNIVSMKIRRLWKRQNTWYHTKYIFIVYLVIIVNITSSTDIWYKVCVRVIKHNGRWVICIWRLALLGFTDPIWFPR